MDKHCHLSKCDMALLGSKKKPSGFIILALIMFTGALAVLLTVTDLHLDMPMPENGSGITIFAIMKLYLMFIFLRTSLHLLLCFANLYFKKDMPELRSRPLVSILVPCYNEEKVLKYAVQSLLKFTYPNIEILIIDDGSGDKTLDVALSLERKGRVRVIHQNNGGKASALNRGLTEAQGEFFMCMDADSALSTDCIEQGLKHFQDDENLAAVAGSVEIGNAKGIIPSFQRLEYVSGLNLFKSAQSYLRMVTVIPGPVGLFRKSYVEKVGGYRLNTYAEDCELTLRLLTAGFGTVYSPLMVAVTEAPEEFSALISQRYRWSRGVMQAIVENWGALAHPIKNPRNFIILAYMTIESLFIPCCNFIFAFVALEYSLAFSSDLFGQFFLQLMFLDVVLALYCAANDDHPFSLIGYSIINRFTYGFSLEMIRFFSIIDECIRIPMSWGKLVRKGL